MLWFERRLPAMRVHLREDKGNSPIAVLRSDRPLESAAFASAPTPNPRTPPLPALWSVRYRTRTGCLLRIGGRVRGAFDRDHESIALSGDAVGDITLEAERRSLPTAGLSPGDGIRWRWMNARAHARPGRILYVRRTANGTAEFGRTPVRRRGAAETESRPAALIGHSHLDVAWLWTYEEAARKAVRTFATAVRQLETDPQFVFTQSQPQLYAFVREREPELFARVAAFARTGRFDASGAALWVESDVNLPSGESLLRQLTFGIRFAERELATSPSVAWLPDSFGFPNTLPTLLTHAGIRAFGTTKLGWNDTTRFPYAQFVWEGPDGSRVVAAQIASIAGAFSPRRVRAAGERGDPLLIGEGDGGGGAPDSALLAAPRFGTWTTLAAWFAGVAEREASLPIVRDELYLEYHRGVATTHHDVKARNAALERGLRDAEETLAWAVALRAAPRFVAEARSQLARAWEIVLLGQFHDVLPGSSIGTVYADTHRLYDEADALVARVASGAAAVLPSTTLDASRRAHGDEMSASLIPPHFESGFYSFESDVLSARVRADGAIVELRSLDGPNLVREANRLSLYRDRPRHWDAWNVDRSYRDRARTVRAMSASVVEGALEIRYEFGRSPAVARIFLAVGEPFLRVELAVAWHERHAMLRCENRLSFAGRRARFGSPHGAVERAVAPRTPAEHAKFEAPGQRYGRLDGPAGGVALLALDTYGWSLETRDGATHLGHSLLRAPTWPDPQADRGEHVFSLAYLPFGELRMGRLEQLWERFARGPSAPARVAMFVPDDDALLVTAVKPADDGDGVVFRARECDGAAREFRIACAVRVGDVGSVDALERPGTFRAPRLEDGAVVAHFHGHELRSFRVRLRDG